ncbi:MAG: Fic family protein, partial [Pirellula sp.]
MTVFNPHFSISTKTANALVRIEAVRQRIDFLPIHPSILLSLRESAKLHSTHYSTFIEGNRLTHEQVGQVVAKSQHFPGRERDEAEVKGYYAAIHELEATVARKGTVTELTIQTLHALVMGGGKKRVKPTPYRESQNVIRDAATRAIVYLPPAAQEVPTLMKILTQWLKDTENNEIPCTIRAGLAQYQFDTI